MATRKIYGTQYDDTITVFPTSFSVVTNTTKTKKAALQVYDVSDFENGVFAGDGKDTVYMVGNSNDAVDGGSGDDLLYGGYGNDLLSGGGGKDTIYGGSGDDIIGAVRPGNTAGSVSDYLIDPNSDTIGDLLIGDGLDPVIFNNLFILNSAVVGNDIIVGGNGKDVIWGDNGPGINAAATTVGGNDQIFGGNGDDTIYGQGGRDTIKGENGNDNIDGGDDFDIIDGGYGADILKGGPGPDYFVYNSALDSTALAMDTIVDFSRDSGDKIDLRSLLGPTDLEWGGYTAKAYGVWLQASGLNTLIKVDTSGDALPDMVIQLNGLFNLRNADFLGVKNTAPTLDPVAGITYNDTAGDDTFSNTPGTLVGADSDANDVVTYKLAGSSPTFETGFDVAKTSDYGSFFLNTSTGAYKFVPDDGAIEALKTTKTVNFSVSAYDGLAESAPRTITVTLNGVNDNPELQDSQGQAETVTELADNDPNENQITHVATGKFVIRDRDLSDQLSWWIDSPNAHLGELSVSAISEPIANGDRKVIWEYTIDDQTMDHLSAASYPENYTIHLSDSAQGTAGATIIDVPVSITLGGSNDAPIRSPNPSDVTERSITELMPSNPNANTGYLHTVTGSFQIQDSDLDDILTIDDIVQSADKSYGKLEATINKAADSDLHTVSWTYSVSDQDLDPLIAGEISTQNFKITISDPSDKIVTQDITIKLLGTTDTKPSNLITELSDSDANENFYAHTLSGDLTASGVASGASLSVVPAPGNPLGLGHIVFKLSLVDSNGNATIHWDFVVADAELDHMSENDDQTLAYTMALKNPDGTTITKELSIFLQGSPDKSDDPKITFAGTVGNDIVTADSARNLIYTFDGVDKLSTTTGDTVFFGGSDTDIIGATSDGKNLLFGESGPDEFLLGSFIGQQNYLWGGAGNDNYLWNDSSKDSVIWVMDFDTQRPSHGGDTIEKVSSGSFSESFETITDPNISYIPIGTKYLHITFVSAETGHTSSLMLVGVELNLQQLELQGNFN